jgi:three-Cys-motif partner protein
MAQKNWGGNWTEKKLQAFEKYVKAYLTIMEKNSYWETIYFDGFAGSGKRKKDCNNEIYNNLLITEEEENLYKGSAERILSIEKSFDFYYFIDKDKKALDDLEISLKQKYDDKRKVFKRGDNNEVLKKLANAMNKKPSKYASLVFLDPFGMQVNWDAIESLKGTRTDIWILVPTGVIVNRLLDKKGELKNAAKLESFLGLSKDDIIHYFYHKPNEINKQRKLFGVNDEGYKKVKEPIEKIANLYTERLSEIWNHVTKKPLVLCNTRNVPIFHFVFASNNIYAMQIAQDIIKKV